MAATESHRDTYRDLEYTVVLSRTYASVDGYSWIYWLDVQRIIGGSTDLVISLLNYSSAKAAGDAAELDAQSNIDHQYSGAVESGKDYGRT